jgi:low temperature requirement protein LtrA
VVRRRKGQRTAWKPTVWIYSHLPLAIGLTATGIGLEFLVAQEGHGVRWVAICGMALALFAMGVIHFATERDEGPERDIIQARIRWTAAALVLLIGLVSESWATNVILVLLALIAAVQIAGDLMLGRTPATTGPTD